LHVYAKGNGGRGQESSGFLANPAPPHEKPQAWVKGLSYGVGAVALLFFGRYCFLD